MNRMCGGQRMRTPAATCQALSISGDTNMAWAGPHVSCVMCHGGDVRGE